MKKLKIDYRTDKFPGKRQYQITTIRDNVITLDDITKYEVSGDIFNSDDINSINQTVNDLIDATASLIATDEKLNDLSTITLPVSGWSATAPFVQIVSVPGMSAKSVPIPGMIYPDSMTELLQAQIDKSTSMITDMESMDGKLKVTCRHKKPIANIIIGLKGVL